MLSSSEPIIDLYTEDGQFIGYACIDCGRPVFDWAAEDDLWQQVMREWDAGHICSDCFMRRAWRLDVHTLMVSWPHASSMRREVV